jgi:hypothetical protein
MVLGPKDTGQRVKTLAPPGAFASTGYLCVDEMQDKPEAWRLKQVLKVNNTGPKGQ